MLHIKEIYSQYGLNFLIDSLHIQNIHGAVPIGILLSLFIIAQFLFQ